MKYRKPVIAGNWKMNTDIESGIKLVKEILDLSDFLPTFCEMSGASVPGGIDGRSLLATLKGGKKKHRDWIHIWYSRNGINRQAKQFVRNQRYNLNPNMHFMNSFEQLYA